MIDDKLGEAFHFVLASLNFVAPLFVRKGQKVFMRIATLKLSV